MKTWLKKYLYIFLILFFVLFLLSYYFYEVFSFSEMSDRGFFGDMFGGISAVFSGLAFFGVLYSLFLQRKELENAAQTRKESEQVLRVQVRSMEKIAKLNGLSSMLQSLGSSLIAAMTGKYPDVVLRDSVVQEMEKIKQEIKKEIEDK